MYSNQTWGPRKFEECNFVLSQMTIASCWEVWYPKVRPRTVGDRMANLYLQIIFRNRIHFVKGLDGSWSITTVSGLSI